MLCAEVARIRLNPGYGLMHYFYDWGPAFERQTITPDKLPLQGKNLLDVVAREENPFAVILDDTEKAIAIQVQRSGTGIENRPGPESRIIKELKDKHGIEARFVPYLGYATIVLGNPSMEWLYPGKH